jgi:peptidyl-prolyl cis-trans isomerase A (cyclophilin A)
MKLFCLALGLLVACNSTPPEPDGRPGDVRKDPVPTAASGARNGTPNPGGDVKGTAVVGSVPVSADDPLAGKWSMADATQGLEGKGALIATIKTSKGTLECKLFDDKAPITVANFIGLARGTRTWKDPVSKQWVKKPAYDGTGFHRIIKGFMIQGGDPKGDGSGEPGYTIPDEKWEGVKHDHAGQLCMANRGANTNGAQFFITDDKAAHLDARTPKDSGYTVFGECAPVEVVHSIAGVPVEPENNRPLAPVKIESVKISRGAGAASPDAGK